ncbi:hypothetical protein CTAYLR_006313 [Chrysophaeum taylorii]|uniref:Major facilitator superfamily (MFS) profile domain-containing protein n=1 Tax=Chrysophaeum taylorii TaxID=2483200 RepID=A0AAD7XJZ6_9STRA|nr:hypothetical protein CTAYLR_006313 [Chrysophaeum taylorii]
MAFAGDVASSMIALTILPQVAARWQLSPLTLATLAATSFAGQVVGAPVWGTLADAWGRKPTFMASQAIVAVFGILTALSPTPRWLVACRALVGLGVGGSEIAMGLLVEFAPPPRGSYLIRVHYVAALGAIYVGGCAWLLDDDNWRLVAALAAVPSSLVAASAACSLEESPRWLASRGRHDEAAAVLAKIWMRHPDAAAPPWISMPTTTATSRCAFFCSSRSLLIWLFWGAFGVAYYGIVGLVGVIYKHDLLFLTVAPTSELLFTYLGARVVDKSRRATAAALATCGALALLAMELVTGPRANTLARGALAYAARGALFGAGGVAWILTPELAPTDVEVAAARGPRQRSSARGGAPRR